MLLSTNEQGRLMIYTAGKLPLERWDRGLKVPRRRRCRPRFFSKGRGRETVIGAIPEPGRRDGGHARDDRPVRSRRPSKLASMTEPIR